MVMERLEVGQGEAEVGGALPALVKDAIDGVEVNRIGGGGSSHTCVPKETTAAIVRYICVH